jgi:hypothetical protein
VWSSAFATSVCFDTPRLTRLVSAAVPPDVLTITVPRTGADCLVEDGASDLFLLLRDLTELEAAVCRASLLSIAAEDGIPCQ